MVAMAFCASGGGTTVRSNLLAIKSGRVQNIEPRVLLVDRLCGACDKAHELGMPDSDIVMLRPRDFPSRKAYGEAIIALFRERGVEWFGQYGWLTRMPKNVVRAFSGINQHPSPHWFGGKGMYGKRPHAAALKFAELVWQRFHRILSHTRVICQRMHPEYDRGEVLHYRTVPILVDDAVSLQQRALSIEWQVQIEALQMLANGTLCRSQSYCADPFVHPGEEDLVEQAIQYALTTET